MSNNDSKDTVGPKSLRTPRKPGNSRNHRILGNHRLHPIPMSPGNSQGVRNLTILVPPVAYIMCPKTMGFVKNEQPMLSSIMRELPNNPPPILRLKTYHRHCGNRGVYEIQESRTNHHPRTKNQEPITNQAQRTNHQPRTNNQPRTKGQKSTTNQ